MRHKGTFRGGLGRARPLGSVAAGLMLCAAATALPSAAVAAVSPAVLPTVTAVSPSAGPAAGGTSVTVTGTNFTAPITVHFGTVAATSVTLVAATVLVAVSPPHPGGVVNVRVTTSAGTSPTSPADHFTYVPKPKVTSVVPNSGPISGGTFVHIHGSGFAGVTTVRFGTATATFTYVNPTLITATSPPHPAATVHVRVTTPYGTSVVAPGNAFTY